MTPREPVREEDLRRELREVLVRRFGALRPGVEARIETASAKELDQFLECAVSEPDLVGVFMTQFSKAVIEHLKNLPQDEFKAVVLAKLLEWNTLGFSDDEVARSMWAPIVAILKGGRSCDGPPFSRGATIKD